MENLNNKTKSNVPKNDEYLDYIKTQKNKKKQFKKIIKAKKKREKLELLAYEQQKTNENKNDPERKNKFKRLFFGVGKEFWRVTWPKKREMLNNFITVIVITLILAGILTGITFLITSFVN